MVLGPRQHLAWMPGVARLLPTPQGTVVFDDGGGGEWSVVSARGASAARRAPQPTSVWLSTTAPVPTVHALVYGPSSGELDWVDAGVHGGVPAAPSVVPLAVSSGTLPPSARVVAAPARGGALLVDVLGSRLTVRTAGASSLGAVAEAELGAPELRIEAAVALEGGAMVALLISGVTEIVALAIDPAGAITSIAAAALPGEVAPSTHYLSHNLAVQGTYRIAAATDAGVFSLQVWTDSKRVHLALDPAFEGSALRGPIDAIWPAPP